MKLDVAVFSNKGTREINEDYVAYKQVEKGVIAVVADGLGGHDKGEIASKHVSTYIVENFDASVKATEGLRKVLEEAQNSLLELQEKESAKSAMKTTAVTLLIERKRAYFAHVGDSRGYAFKKHKKYIRTMDHSVPQMLVLTGDIKESEIRSHDERSSLLRVIGSPWEKETVEISEKINLNKVEAFLLCSDGFWELIEEDDMMKFMKEANSASEWVASMAQIDEANGAGKEMDNYTACAIFVRKR